MPDFENPTSPDNGNNQKDSTIELKKEVSIEKVKAKLADKTSKSADFIKEQLAQFEGIDADLPKLIQSILRSVNYGFNSGFSSDEVKALKESGLFEDIGQRTILTPSEGRGYIFYWEFDGDEFAVKAN